MESGVVVLVSNVNDKVNLIAMATKDAVAKWSSLWKNN